MAYKLDFHEWKETGYQYTVTIKLDNLTTTVTFATKKEAENFIFLSTIAYKDFIE